MRATYADEIDQLVGFWGPLGVTKVLVLHYDDVVGKQNYETVAKALEKYGKVPTASAQIDNVAVWSGFPANFGRTSAPVLDFFQVKWR